jgi:hypothetical protein
MLGREGYVVQLSVLRPGEMSELMLRPALIAYRSPSGVHRLAMQAMNFYPLFFLIVGMLVLGLRLEDRNAWLLALLFAGFICGAPLFEGSISPHLRGLAASYKMTFGTLAPAVFCYFFLSFPTPSPIDRRLPHLKVVLLWLTPAYSVSLGLVCLLAGGLYPNYTMFGWVSRRPLAMLPRRRRRKPRRGMRVSGHLPRARAYRGCTTLSDYDTGTAESAI